MVVTLPRLVWYRWVKLSVLLQLRLLVNRELSLLFVRSMLVVSQVMLLLMQQLLQRMMLR